MEFMPGPRLNENEDYFTYGPPNFNQNTEPPIDYSPKRNQEFNKKYGDYKPADYFDEQLSYGMTKGILAGKREEQFLNPYSAVPADAPADVKNLMNGLRGQPIRFNRSNVNNGVGFNNDLDNLELGAGYVSAVGPDGRFRIDTDGISGQYRPGQTGISGDISFNPVFNGAAERVSGGVRYTSPDRRFNAGITGTAAEGQNPTFKGNIGYNGENGGFSAEAGIDAQGQPDVGLKFDVGQPQLSKEEIALKKGMVPAQITDALNPNPNVSPQLPPQMTGEPFSPGRQFAMKYINDKFREELGKGGSSLLY